MKATSLRYEAHQAVRQAITKVGREVKIETLENAAWEAVRKEKFDNSQLKRILSLISFDIARMKRKS